MQKGKPAIEKSSCSIAFSCMSKNVVKKRFFSGVRKITVFAVRAGAGGFRKLRTCPQLLDVFFRPSLTASLSELENLKNVNCIAFELKII